MATKPGKTKKKQKEFVSVGPKAKLLFLEGQRELLKIKEQIAELQAKFQNLNNGLTNLMAQEAARLKIDAPNSTFDLNRLGFAPRA